MAGNSLGKSHNEQIAANRQECSVCGRLVDEADATPNAGYAGKGARHKDGCPTWGDTDAKQHDLAPEDLFDMAHDYRNAPSNTASAMTGEQWAQAWAKEWQRANRAEAKLEELRQVLDA